MRDCTPPGSAWRDQSAPLSVVPSTTGFRPDGEAAVASQRLADAHATSVIAPAPAGTFWVFQFAPPFTVNSSMPPAGNVAPTAAQTDVVGQATPTRSVLTGDLGSLCLFHVLPLVVPIASDPSWNPTASQRVIEAQETSLS